MNKTPSESTDSAGMKIGAARPANDWNAVVRPAHSTDALALCILMRKYWEFEGIPNFDSAHITSLLRTALSQGGGAYAWLAEDPNGQPLGYLLAVTQFSFEYGGLAAEIDELYVQQQVRGIGLGVALLNAAEDSLRLIGVCCLQLQLSTRNLEAREFYRRHAFTRRAGYELWDKRLTLATER
jgi:GNAT superfamily N-acetyltransferase